MRLLGLALPLIALLIAAAPPAKAQPMACAPSAARPPERLYPNMMHVGIVVPDVEAAVSEAGKRFGFGEDKIVGCFTLNLKDVLYNNKKASFSAKYWLVELGNTEIEFIEPVGDSPSPYRDALKARGAAAHHLAFRVESIDAQIARARADNPKARVVLDALVPGGGARFVYVDGVIPGILVEYVESAH